MDKQQLIEYLDAVCDAESAVQACEDAIAVLEGEKRRLPQPFCPAKPTHDAVTRRTEIQWNRERVSGVVGMAGYMYIPVYIAVFIVMANTTGSTDLIVPLFVAAAISLIASILWMNTSEKRKMDEDYRARQNEVSKQNAERDQEYAHAMTIYQNNMPIYTSSMALIDGHIQKQMQLRDGMRILLDKLYAQDIIFNDFRNLVAVFQIRAYLQMGVCDGLEGTGGAYAMYLNDVRTARITDSIHDLKASLTSAIRSLQGTLMQELRTVNGNLTELGSSMSRSMEGISRQMQQMHRLQQAGTAQMSAHLAEANRHLVSMRDNTAVIAHNQYVEQRLRNVDAYLLRHP
ncbi:MAG: hypothetical protein IJE07_04545 [Clostridia bacterium]|nr:hypothetical protein [Clostridia bacterium]